MCISANKHMHWFCFSSICKQIHLIETAKDVSSNMESSNIKLEIIVIVTKCDSRNTSNGVFFSKTACVQWVNKKIRRWNGTYL